MQHTKQHTKQHSDVGVSRRREPSTPPGTPTPPSTSPSGPPGTLFLCPPRSCLTSTATAHVSASAVAQTAPVCYSAELQRVFPSSAWRPAYGNATLAGFLGAGYVQHVC